MTVGSIIAASAAAAAAWARARAAARSGGSDSAGGASAGGASAGGASAGGASAGGAAGCGARSAVVEDGMPPCVPLLAVAPRVALTPAPVYAPVEAASASMSELRPSSGP